MSGKEPQQPIILHVKHASSSTLNLTAQCHSYHTTSWPMHYFSSQIWGRFSQEWRTWRKAPCSSEWSTKRSPSQDSACCRHGGSQNKETLIIGRVSKLHKIAWDPKIQDHPGYVSNLFTGLHGWASYSKVLSNHLVGGVILQATPMKNLLEPRVRLEMPCSFWEMPSY